MSATKKAKVAEGLRPEWRGLPSDLILDIYKNRPLHELLELRKVSRQLREEVDAYLATLTPKELCPGLWFPQGRGCSRGTRKCEALCLAHIPRWFMDVFDHVTTVIQDPALFQSIRLNLNVESLDEAEENSFDVVLNNRPRTEQDIARYNEPMSQREKDRWRWNPPGVWVGMGTEDDYQDDKRLGAVGDGRVKERVRRLLEMWVRNNVRPSEQQFEFRIQPQRAEAAGPNFMRALTARTDLFNPARWSYWAGRHSYRILL